jgi:hypothetical protein
MTELVIHAGTHKTATTTIQETLAANRERLAACGLVYPAIGQAAGHHLLVSEWLDHLAAYRDGRSPEEHWRALAAEHAAGPDTVLLSSEEFARKGPQHVDLAALRARAAPFARCRIVYVLRNQVAYIQSLYLEMQRQYRMPPFGEYVRQCLARDHASGMYLDYGELYATACAAFAPGEVRLLSYEALAGTGRPIAAAFLAAIGCDAAAEAVQPLSGRNRSNASPEPLAAWVANQVTAPEIAGPGMVDLVDGVLRDAFGPDVATTLFTRAEIERLAARYEPLNRALEARYGAVAPGFALAPLRLGDGLVHRDELTPGFWLKLARRLHRANASVPEPTPEKEQA